jgi:hypothetical protein
MIVWEMHRYKAGVFYTPFALLFLSQALHRSGSFDSRYEDSFVKGVRCDGVLDLPR